MAVIEHGDQESIGARIAGVPTMDAPGAAPEAGPLMTLAMRIAQRSRLRAERAARLDRLRGEAPAPADDAGAALEEFLRALTGGAPEAAPDPGPARSGLSGAVLHFQRPGGSPERPCEPRIEEAVAVVVPVAVESPPAPACDLDRLPGIGPGLVGALRRAGLHSLAEIAALEAAELAARLGPIGRLVPAPAWIAAARAAAAEG